MATPAEQDAGEVRDSLEEKLVPVLVTALAARPESEQAATPAAVQRGVEAAYTAAVVAMLTALVAQLRRSRRINDEQARKMMRDKKAQQELDEKIASAAKEIADVSTDWAARHIDTLIERDVPTQPVDRAWAQQAARSLATQAAARAVEDAAAVVAPAAARAADDDTLGEGWRKVWISRGDSRVRPLHRKLHGQPCDMDKAFWRWPIDGKQLRFPGDPLAPIGETANCRCALFYVPAEVSPSEVTEALAPADFENSFDLVASAGFPDEQQALRDFIEEQERR